MSLRSEVRGHGPPTVNTAVAAAAAVGEAAAVSSKYSNSRRLQAGPRGEVTSSE